jgi:hypothetical protein
MCRLCVNGINTHGKVMKLYTTQRGNGRLMTLQSVTDNDLGLLRGKGIDVICGGFPCQAFSVAGKRGGFDDTRGTLFFEIARFAQQIKPRFYSLKTLKGYYLTTKGTRSELSSIRWMNLGMTQNGKCLTLKISESPKTEKGCSLSDILEEQVDEKYFLSSEVTKRLVLKS